MKILVVSQHYKPEPFRLSDICEELTRRGHEVTVVTGVPNYPEGYIYENYKNGKNREEVINGVKVYRSFTIGRRKNILFRFLNYYSFALSSSFNTFFGKYGKDYDAILVSQTSPVMMSYAGVVYKKRFKKKLLIYCLDLWPESLLAGGVSKRSILYKYYHKVSSKIYNAADKILVSSRGFSTYLEKEFSIRKENISYLPQYAEDVFKPNFEVVKKDTVDFVFAGNAGAAQGLDIVIAAADELRQYKNIVFHIVGEGSEMNNLRSLAHDKKLENVVFHGRRDISEMPKFYSMADAMLVTLRDYEAVSLTLPGKVQTYMAAGKPIIASINGEASKVVSDAKCGLTSAAEDVESFVKNILHFVNLSAEERLEFGKNARTYYEENFEKEIVITNLEKYLNETETQS